MSFFFQKSKSAVSLLVTFSSILLFVGPVYAVQHAINPSCITIAGSASCGVGINPPTSATLEGGYQWLSEESITTSVSGTLTTEGGVGFTASQTNFLDVTQITTTNSVGATVTSSSTDYFSFVSATPTPSTGSGGGGATGPIIIALIMAPATVTMLEPVGEGIATKTVQQLAEEITNIFKKNKLQVTAGTVQKVAQYLKAASVPGGAFILNVYMSGATITADPITSTPTSTMMTSTRGGGIPPSSASLSDPEITVTAIVDTPYTNWRAILAIPFPTATLPPITSSIITRITSSPFSKETSTPFCLHGADPHGTRLPANYCMCGPNGKLYYSAVTGSNPCPYTTTPGPTVTWSDTPGPSITQMPSGNPSSTPIPPLPNPLVYKCQPASSQPSPDPALAKANTADFCQQNSLAGQSSKTYGTMGKGDFFNFTVAWQPWSCPVTFLPLGGTNWPPTAGQCNSNCKTTQQSSLLGLQQQCLSIFAQIFASACEFLSPVSMNMDLT